QPTIAKAPKRNTAFMLFMPGHYQVPFHLEMPIFTGFREGARTSGHALPSSKVHEEAGREAHVKGRGPGLRGRAQDAIARDERPRERDVHRRPHRHAEMRKRGDDEMRGEAQRKLAMGGGESGRLLGERMEGDSGARPECDEAVRREEVADVRSQAIERDGRLVSLL